MAKLKIKSIKNLKKAPSAPSAVSKSKPKPAKASKVKADDPHLKLDKRKRAETAKKIAKLSKPDPERDKVLHANYMEYLKHTHRSKWGNANLDPDAKGQDGYNTLRLDDYMKSALNIRNPITKILADDAKIVKSAMDCAIYNIWQWANFCSRLWMDTLALDPPVRRVVEIKLSDIFPYADTPKVIDFYVNKAKDNKDMQHALRNLALMRYKVRMILSITDDQSVSQKSLYKLFDLMHFTPADKSIWGVCLKISSKKDYSKYPRDVVILQPTDLRKSTSVDSYLDNAIDAGYRVILPYDMLKDGYSKISEIRQSSKYSKLIACWHNLSPLITMSLDSKMVKVDRVSKLSDILLT